MARVQAVMNPPPRKSERERVDETLADVAHYLGTRGDDSADDETGEMFRRWIKQVHLAIRLLRSPDKGVRVPPFLSYEDAKRMMVDPVTKNPNEFRAGYEACMKAWQKWNPELSNRIASRATSRLNPGLRRGRATAVKRKGRAE